MARHSAKRSSARPLSAVRSSITTSLTFATAGALIVSAPGISPQLTARDMQVVADTQRALSYADTNLLAAASPFDSLFEGLPVGALNELQNFLAAASATAADPQGVDSLDAPDIDDLQAHLEQAGFAGVHIELNESSRSFIRNWSRESGAERFVAAAAIRAVRPAGDGCCGTARRASSCC